MQRAGRGALRLTIAIALLAVSAIAEITVERQSSMKRKMTRIAIPPPNQSASFTSAWFFRMNSEPSTICFTEYFGGRPPFSSLPSTL